MNTKNEDFRFAHATNRALRPSALWLRPLLLLLILLGGTMATRGLWAQQTATVRPPNEQKQSTFIGKVISVTKGALAIKNDQGKQYSFAVNKDTRCTLNGLPVDFDRIEKGFTVNVKAVRKQSKYIAKRVDATRN